MAILHRGTLGAALLCLAHTTSPGRADEPAREPWKIDTWKQPPQFRWLSQTGPVQSLIYTGEKYQGRDTEVFAFYASPATLGEAKRDAKFPGVVLIHGGGGTAFAEWVWLWAKRGYAAIAMDLAGCRPIDPIYDASGAPVANQASKPDTRTRLASGGPPQGHPEKFDSIGGDFSDDWPFHAVASVMKAHSLLRSFPEVMADRTAVTGISWGGYTTCLVASLDDRFQAAVPVYGCGYLFEGESVQKPSIDKLADRRDEWIKQYDPSSVLGRCRVPILFVNGTNDIHYPLDSYQKSFDKVPGVKQMRIEVNMRHGHPPGWEPQEIGLFIDSFCRLGKPLPVPGAPTVTGDHVLLPYTSAVPLKSAAVHYTADGGLRSARTWQSLPAQVGELEVTAPLPPANANTWFISLTDERGAMVTSGVHFQP
jgi:dienelactone hydrolase